MPGTERERVASFGHPEDGLYDATPWYHWGPYLSERAWGTVREDYSADGSAWDYFPHDHARSRAYRWGEDGMAGVSDVGQNLCMALALWNGRDPILKERMFGLTGPAGQPRGGRQGVLVVPRRPAQPRVAAVALPLPAGRVPLRRPGRRERPAGPEPARVRAPGHRRRSTTTATGWSTSSTPRPTRTTCSWRSASPTPARRPATLHVLPHLWFRNTWSWDDGAARPVAAGRRARPGRAWTTRASVSWPGTSTSARTARRRSCCSARTTRTWRGCTAPTRLPRIPKDGINDHVVAGAPTVNPDRSGRSAPPGTG